MKANELEQRAFRILTSDWGDPQAALDAALEALRLREQAHDPDHVALIWPLALVARALRMQHDLESARRSAAYGERRLRLVARVLAPHPMEARRAYQDLVELYHFEDQTFDATRVAELRAERDALQADTRGKPHVR